jgi:hypothetical protein
VLIRFLTQGGRHGDSFRAGDAEFDSDRHGSGRGQAGQLKGAGNAKKSSVMWERLLRCGAAWTATPGGRPGLYGVRRDILMHPIEGTTLTIHAAKRSPETRE